jgi:hypothetical protein
VIEPGTYEAVELEVEEELWTDDSSSDHAGWFCVATDPFPCPASGCSFVAMFMTAAHLILVWEHRDATRAWSATSPSSGAAPPTTPGRPPAARCTGFARSSGYRGQG